MCINMSFLVLAENSIECAFGHPIFPHIERIVHGYEDGGLKIFPQEPSTLTILHNLLHLPKNFLIIFPLVPNPLNHFPKHLLPSLNLRPHRINIRIRISMSHFRFKIHWLFHLYLTTHVKYFVVSDVVYRHVES